MMKPATYSIASRKAAPLAGAAFALCALLVFGLLWPVPASFAADESAPAKDAVGNVVVEVPTPSEPAVQPDPQPQPEPEPTVPEAPAAPEPALHNTWLIGADEASSVVAELWADGTFVVDGAGAAVAFANVEDVPWLVAGAADDVERVIFADKVEVPSLAHWFEGCSNLHEVVNVPADVEDLTRAFYDCPKLVELPDEFAFADEAVTEACFGFEEPAETPLVTLYRGADENVLAYTWELDGRKLVNPDASKPPATEDPQDPAEPTGPAGDLEAPEASGAPKTPEAAESPLDSTASADASAEQPKDPVASESGQTCASPEQAQVSITVPSSVSMILNAGEGDTALIPVMAANRSERNAAIVGACLKSANQTLPGGSWSLTSEDGSMTFAQDAHFTPLGLEVMFDQSVILPAGGQTVALVWRGAFAECDMKTLVSAVIDAGDEGLAYGLMIWIVAPA